MPVCHAASWIPLVWLLGACAGPPAVRPGIDVLLDDSLHLVTGRRVGLLANHAGVDARGVDDLTRLTRAGIVVTALFAPEHGWRGLLDTENIGDGRDSATGIPVYSLYRDIRAPTPAMLATVDVILVDLPDIGARTFTYVSTALRTIEAAGAAGVPVIVLDRPNPLGGVQVQGPVLDTALASFVGMLPVPLRHGMTLAELVDFGRDALALEGTVITVPVTGWRRTAWFDATGLPWIRPSPNMPDLESATHYPGFVLFEATDLSVGRGTPLAFQVIGAPWLDAAGLAGRLDVLPGLAARDTVVTPVGPTDGKHGGVSLPAVRLAVTDRAAYDPTAAAVAALVWIRDRHGPALGITPRRFDQLAGTRALREAIEAGTPADSIVASWVGALEGFARDRARHLLY